MVEPINAVLARAAQLTTDGRPRAAIELLRPVLVVHPDHSAAWCRLSVAYLDAGQLTDSLDAANRAITLGERSWAHRLASLALGELGRYDESVTYARESVHRDPIDWRCHVALAEALAHTSVDEAVDAARRAVDLAPREARPQEVLGDVAAKAQDIPLAKQAYRDALLLDPGSAHVAAKLDALNARGRPVPVPPRVERPPVPERFGRAERIALWLPVRGVSAWLTFGCLLLLVAGLSSLTPLLVWFGFALVMFAIWLAARGWRTMPAVARLGLDGLKRFEPLALLCLLLLGLSGLALVVWTIALAMGSHGLAPLVVALVCAAASTGLGSLRIWRLKVRTR